MATFSKNYKDTFCWWVNIKKEASPYRLKCEKRVKTIIDVDGIRADVALNQNLNPTYSLALSLP
jgi:hypothetical protein